MINTFLGWINQILGMVLFFLPNDPLKPFISSMEGAAWLGMLNWFIPFGTMVGIGYAWLSAVAIFYAVKVLLRWAKAIE
jgi:hypothetical protein